MKFFNAIDAQALATKLQAKLVGSPTVKAYGLNEINRVDVGDVVFVDHPKYYNKCLQSAASIIIINEAVDCPEGKALLIVANPFDAYQQLAMEMRPNIFQKKIIGEGSIIDESAIIYPNTVIGNNVRIGANTIIYSNVFIYDNTTIGENVIVHGNTTIGADAFYYNSKKDRQLWYKKMHNCGNVQIEDDVEIGAGCTIDKGVTSTTRIGAGSKIDNQCHIAHDVVIGKNCLIAAQVGIAGATTLEDGVTVWAQTGINKTLTVGANATIMARSGVPSNLEGGKTYWGSPTQDFNEAKKELIWIKRIPLLWEKVMGKK
jgi:UDP-3-O-[3-hydroxymyristoyl] glucosamine N-acyltransferase